MEFTTSTPPLTGAGTGFSVALAERVLREAATLGLCDAWAQLHLGNPSGRRTAYRPEQRQAVRRHGRFQEVLCARHYLMVDVDGQGLVARGPHFERTAVGHLGEGIDRGYQRYVCYAADTHEVLDEFLAPNNRTLMSQLPEVLTGLDAVIPRADRKRVIWRLGSHGGASASVRARRAHGYHYLCRLLSWAAVKRLREHLQGKHGGLVRGDR